MTIDADVREKSAFFGIDEKLIQAVVQAEGDIVKAIQCSLPSVETRDKALEVLCRSAVHAMSDWIRLNDKEDFVGFWAARWAPDGAANDPRALNGNWENNVYALWTA